MHYSIIRMVLIFTHCDFISKLRKIPCYHAANIRPYACVHGHGGIRFWRLNAIQILFGPLKIAKCAICSDRYSL